MVAVVCAAVQLVGCGGGGGGQGSVPGTASRPPTTQLWILQGPGLEAQAMATNPEGIAFFSNPSIAVLYPVRSNVPAPSAWNVRLWQKYTSFAAFQSAVRTGTVPAGTAIVGYDDEAWSQTPPEEQNDPIKYTIEFAQLAHQSGYSVIAMPSEDLMQAKFPGQDKFASFISYGMAKAVAPYLDYYDIQSQDLETSPSAYASFTQAIAIQVHSAHGSVVITDGLSTSLPTQTQIAPVSIDAAVGATSSLVSGYWLNVVGATTPIAAAALANFP
jgi:hypothetical protein